MPDRNWGQDTNLTFWICGLISGHRSDIQLVRTTIVSEFAPGNNPTSKVTKSCQRRLRTGKIYEVVFWTKIKFSPFFHPRAGEMQGNVRKCEETGGNRRKGVEISVGFVGLSISNNYLRSSVNEQFSADTMYGLPASSLFEIESPTKPTELRKKLTRSFKTKNKREDVERTHGLDDVGIEGVLMSLARGNRRKGEEMEIRRSVNKATQNEGHIRPMDKNCGIVIRGDEVDL
ncbi:hypothetical protein IW261DRAFT_1425531 [Armillaria novae-zelandiae]|uniref:Uncharacterized protein n=1 Tax=Armillaria novae-zelandiae TaxID=153914 RepID=A0AA39U5E0_9AGAR|nr:hypothetical protein IW261DRAFT_1425531 [Armillaria novae-zelandiae]